MSIIIKTSRFPASSEVLPPTLTNLNDTFKKVKDKNVYTEPTETQLIENIQRDNPGNNKNCKMDFGSC